MIEQIEQLIINKEFMKASLLLEKGLTKNFDFSDKKDRNNYNRLHELRNEISGRLVESVNLEIKEKMGDVWGGIGAVHTFPFDFILRLFAKKMTLVEAFSKIIPQKSTLLFEKEYDAYVCIIDKKKISEEIATECSYPPQEQLKQLNVGEKFITQTRFNRPCYSVVGFNDTDESGMTLVTKGLMDTIDEIYTKRHERVGIILSLHEEYNTADYREIYFYFILFSLLIKILRSKGEQFQPCFYFIFQDDLGSELFEKTKIQISQDKAPECIPSNREAKLKELAELCMTQDPEYIARLKSVLNVIDEEDVSILLLGESGVGKSFLAKIIHDSSNRNKSKFEEQNCGELLEDRQSAGLWGSKKGSYTDSKEDIDGKVKRAEGGTLFLDEIDRTTQKTRNGLLTFIETKRYEPLGSKMTETGNVRLIFGSNKDFKDLIKRGLFEPDFYDRISRRKVHIPPLRERVNDIDLIITKTLDELNEKNDRFIILDEKGRKYLNSFSWPGNTRQLVTYIQDRFIDANAEDQTNITLEQMQAAPFENLSVAKEEDYEKLIEILRQLLTDWDGTKGSFSDEIIAPILAKIYMDETHMHMNKTKKWEGAMELLGISGGKYNTSSLAKYYEKFPSVKEKLGF